MIRAKVHNENPSIHPLGRRYVNPGQIACLFLIKMLTLNISLLSILWSSELQLQHPGFWSVISITAADLAGFDKRFEVKKLVRDVQRCSLYAYLHPHYICMLRGSLFSWRQLECHFCVYIILHHKIDWRQILLSHIVGNLDQVSTQAVFIKNV